LAVLYYTTGQYQTAIDHCTPVMKSHDHSQCSSRVVQGELLPKIDNEIDNVLGLAVFYQYVRTAVLSQQQTQHDIVFTPELFAYYLCIRCLSVTQCRLLISTHLTDEIQRYQKCFYESPEMFIVDVMAFKSIGSIACTGNLRKLRFVKDQTKPVTSGKLNTSELVELLKQSAVKHLTASRQREALMFASVAVIATTDYEALYAYKCGEYQRCLQLSTDNVRMLIGAPASVLLILASSEFIQLMDDDIVSLSGLMLIVNPSCRNDYVHITITQMAISSYLMAQCQMKLHHSIRSLAQTFNCIEIARQKSKYQLFTADQLLLKFTQRKILIYISAHSE